MKLRFRLDVVTQIRSFLSSFLLKLKFKTLFPNCYYDSIPKPCFRLAITIQIWRFACDFSFEFKLECLPLTSNSNSVQMRSQRWNIDPNFFLKFSLNLCIRVFVRIQTRIFFPNSDLSKKLEVTFQIEIQIRRRNSRWNSSKKSKTKLLTLD